MPNIFAIIILLLSSVRPLLGQTSVNVPSECPRPEEKFMADPTASKSNERNKSDKAVTLTFEDDFKDTVSIWVADKLILKKYMESDAEGGFADRVSVKVRPRTRIVIKTVDSDCTHFFMKRGYKYVYIQRYRGSQWTVTYSNYRRGYY